MAHGRGHGSGVRFIRPAAAAFEDLTFHLAALVAGAAGLVGNLLPPRGEAGRLRRALKAKDLNETYKAELSAELAGIRTRTARKPRV